MGSRRYWIVVGVLAVIVGVVVFAMTSTEPEPAAVYLADVVEPTTTETPRSTTTDPFPTTTTDPPTTTTTPSWKSTTTSPGTCAEDPDADISLCPPPPTLPSMVGAPPDWLSNYEQPPGVLSGQVVDLDGDGDPDIALFGAAESPLIYPIDDEAETVDPASAAELEAAQDRITELEEVTNGLQDQLRDRDDPRVGSALEPPPDGETDTEPETTRTVIDPNGGAQSSGLTTTQESLLLAFISTAGVVLVGIGAPVMGAWARRRFGEPTE